MATATLVRPNLPDFRGTVNLYRLSPPLITEEWDDDYETQHSVSHEFVVVSAAVVPFSGPETYIFPATEAGEVTDWGELPGSYRGGLSHDEALAAAGYEVSA